MFSNVHARAVNIRTGIPFKFHSFRSKLQCSSLIRYYPPEFLSLIIQCICLMVFFFLF